MTLRSTSSSPYHFNFFSVRFFISVAPVDNYMIVWLSQVDIRSQVANHFLQLGVIFVELEMSFRLAYCSSAGVGPIPR